MQTVPSSPLEVQNEIPDPQPPGNRGWQVTFAGTGINLALGVLYSWSVISKGVPADWQWDETAKALPYAVACLIFSVVMVPAGRMQDRIGPRRVASVGGLLVGVGMILASLSTSVMAYVLGFGVLAGAGLGFGYASATPPAVKWFPAARTGLIAGIVVSGFGLASVYIAPLATFLIKDHGVPATMMTLGIGFLIVVIGLAQLLQSPPRGFVPAATNQPTSASPAKRDDFAPGEMLRTWQFYALWFTFACGAGAGLMVISKLAVMVDVQAGVKLGFELVAVLAMGNGAGRILAGFFSDKIGRKMTLTICFIFQAVLIYLLSRAGVGNALGEKTALAVLCALIGANYGANLALFPSVTKDFYGLKNFGVNYGLVFTAWGLGGFMLSFCAGKIYDHTKSFNFAYHCSAALLLAAALITLFIKPPRTNR